MGLLNQTPPEAEEAPVEEKGQDFSASPKSIQEQVSGEVPPELQEAFGRVVQAGMKVMFSQETHDMMIETLQGEGTLGENIGEGITALMMLLYKKSNGSMPPFVIIPAGIYLMMASVDFVEQITGEEVTPDIISEAMQIFIGEMAKSAGIDPDQLAGGMDQLAAQQPAQPQGAA